MMLEYDEERERELELRAAQMVLDEVLTPMFGSASGRLIFYSIGRWLGKSPYEAFLDEPNKFYDVLRRSFSFSADSFLSLLCRKLAEYGLAIGQEELIEIFTSDSVSSHLRIRTIFSRIGRKAKVFDRSTLAD